MAIVSAFRNIYEALLHVIVSYPREYVTLFSHANQIKENAPGSVSEGSGDPIPATLTG
jgi:hypothetical protein